MVTIQMIDIVATTWQMSQARACENYNFGTSGGENTSPPKAARCASKGPCSLAGTQSIWFDTTFVRGPIDFPFPTRIGPVRCSGILQSDSRGQLPHDRCANVEPLAHESFNAVAPRLSDRGEDRLRVREPIVSARAISRNRERFPKEVTCALPSRHKCSRKTIIVTARAMESAIDSMCDDVFDVSMKRAA
jgi:hypothetical protein